MGGKTKRRLPAFSQRLSEARRNTGLSAEKFAEKYNYGVSTYTSWEKPSSGKEPEYATLVELADILNVSVDFLLGRDENPNPKMKHISEYVGLSQPAAAKLEGLSKTCNGKIFPLNGLIMDSRFEPLIYLLLKLHNEALEIERQTQQGIIPHSQVDLNPTEHVISGSELLRYDLGRSVDCAREIFSHICMVDNAVQNYDALVLKRLEAEYIKQTGDEDNGLDQT